MRFISLFSGIEAASCAWLPLGWECVAVAEIEPFPCKVLAHHYPEVPNLGDITKITEAQIKALGHIDLVVGGFPCQDLSVAGKRKGLKNEDGSSTRSGLFYDAMRIVRWAGVRYCLLENVPGIYSSNRGRDFAAVVGEILGVQFGVPANGWENTGVAASDRGLLEWATLDAQWFGVAQRRRRMFALADFGDWRSRGPVLFESHSLSGNPAPRRESTEVVTPTIRAGASNSGAGHGARSGDSKDELIVPVFSSTGEIAHCLNAGGMGRQDYETETMVTHTLRGEGFDASEDGTGRGTPPVPVSVALRGREGGATAELGDECAWTLRASSGGGDKPHVLAPVAFAQNQRDEVRTMDVAGALAAEPGSKQQTYLHTGMAVRRLVPEECEKLQGFLPGYTDIRPKGKATPDGPRYKALGNSMCVNVMLWIGQRIAAVAAQS